MTANAEMLGMFLCFCSTDSHEDATPSQASLLMRIGCGRRSRSFTSELAYSAPVSSGTTSELAYSAPVSSGTTVNRSPTRP